MSFANDASNSAGERLLGALEALVTTLNEQNVRYAIIGGLATLQYTRVRTTDDIDAIVTIPQLAMPAFFDALSESGFSVDRDRNIREFSSEGFTIIRFGDVVVDLLKPVVPAYAHVLDRAIRTNIFGQSVMVSSVECLIVTKLMAMRPQDQTDIRDLLTAFSGKLDLDFIRAEMESFAGSDDKCRAKFDAWVREARGSI